MTEERSHEFTRGLYGWITHTDLSSTDPDATREWCTSVLGWSSQPPFPTPQGDYHLFAYSEAGRHPRVVRGRARGGRRGRDPADQDHGRCLHGDGARARGRPDRAPRADRLSVPRPPP
jgi:hypothetical protein